MRILTAEAERRRLAPVLPRRLWLVSAIGRFVLGAGRVVPMLLFGYIAVSDVRGFLQLLGERVPGQGRLDALAYYGSLAHIGLAAVFMGSMAILCLIRKEPVRKLSRLTPQIVAFAGTWLVTAVALQPKVPGAWWVPIVSSVLMVAGMAFAVAAILVLGRSFGILPEARGLVTTGPYRYVRHPLYSAEALFVLGMLLPVLSPVSVTIYGTILVLQALRTRYEEEVLTDVFPEYKAYRRATWRFIPGVF